MNNEGNKGKCCQGTFIKDSWIKPNGVGLRVGGGFSWGRGRGWEKMETNVLEKQ